MPRLIIKRKWEWTTWTRLAGIYLDGEKVGTILNGQTEEFELAEGDHKLKARVDWCTSKDFLFSIAENETKYIRLSAFKHAETLVAIVCFLFIAHLVIWQSTGFSYVKWLIILFTFVPIYYMTFGYNKYLWVREDKLGFSF